MYDLIIIRWLKECMHFIKSYPRFTFVKSKATCRYDTAFSFRYRLYRRINVDMSYPETDPKQRIYQCTLSTQSTLSGISSLYIKPNVIQFNWQSYISIEFLELSTDSRYLVVHFCPKSYWGWITYSWRPDTEQNAAKQHETEWRFFVSQQLS